MEGRAGEQERVDGLDGGFYERMGFVTRTRDSGGLGGVSTSNAIV